MPTHARCEHVPAVPRIGSSVAAVTSIVTVRRTEGTDIDGWHVPPKALVEEMHACAQLPRRIRSEVASSRDALSAEKIVTRLQELVAIQQFLHARDARR